VNLSDYYNTGMRLYEFINTLKQEV